MSVYTALSTIYINLVGKVKKDKEMEWEKGKKKRPQECHLRQIPGYAYAAMQVRPTASGMVVSGLVVS